jgi:hypothetical protein
VLDVDVLLDVELVVLVLVELVLVDESTVLLSVGLVSDGFDDDGTDSELADGSGKVLDSSIGCAGCSSTGAGLSASGTMTSSSGVSLLSGIVTTLSTVPVSTINEESFVSSPAFSTPLRILTSPPIKTRTPQTPSTIFFMNVSPSKSD